MAQKTIIQLVDDIDGKPLGEGEGETVTFALDGTTYEIDLSLKNADRFRGVFQDYIAAARKVGRKTGTAGKRTQTTNAAEVRAWAQSQGIDVPERGRIPASVKEAFDAR